MFSSSLTNEERHTESVTGKVGKQDTKKSRFKIRRSSLSHTVYRANNEVDSKRKMSTGKYETALYPPSTSIPTSLQTSPVIPDKRFANVSRLPRLKNDASGAKSRNPREDSATILSRINRDRLERWSESLHELLTDSVGIRLFEDFLVKECSQENLAFWRSCKKFSDPWMTPDDKLQSVAESIFSEFISHQAPNLVNIDHTVRTNVMSRMTAGVTRNMFDQAVASIYMLMERDSYSRFVKQSEFREALALSKVF